MGSASTTSALSEQVGQEHPRQALGPTTSSSAQRGDGRDSPPLLWCISYDPVIELASRTTGAPCPTYVDDLAALLGDAAQALRLCFLLPWVSRAIGLLIATHTCRTLLVPAPDDDTLRAIQTLPVDCISHEDGVRLVGLTPELVRKLLERRVGAARLSGAIIHETPCRCSLK